MAEIRLTHDDDVYEQKESDRHDWNNVFGRGGNDTLKVYSGTLIGGPGDDLLEQLPFPDDPNRGINLAYWDSPNGVRVNLLEGWADDGFGTRDTLKGYFRTVMANSGDDHVTGTDRPEFFHGNLGRDVFIGNGGSDGVGIPHYWVNGQEFSYTLDQVHIEVSADGRKAVVFDLETNGMGDGRNVGFRYELTDVEFLEFSSPGYTSRENLYLIDLISPLLVAKQTIAAGENYRFDTSQPIGSAQTISFSFMTSATAGADASAPGFRAFSDAEKALVRDIFSKTSALIGLTFKEVSESSAAHGQIRFGVTQQTDTKGYTIIPGTPGAGSKAGDIFMDVESMLGIKVGSEGYEALLHEIGHALGLRHPRNIDLADKWDIEALESFDDRALTVMATVDSSDGLYRSSWGPLDWAALQYLYGAKPVQTGNNTYVLDASSFDSRTTIVDHGGTDTIDGSLSTVGVYIDLKAGAASSVGMTSAGRAGSQNIAIGVDTEIENAVGTVFDDVLIGNALNNRFWALSGNDWIDGGAGHDAAVFSADSSEYSLAISSGTLTLESYGGTQGFATLTKVESLVFGNKAIDLQTASHSSYSDVPAELYQFFIVAFNAAPGVTYMDQLAEAYRFGYSVKQIVDVFITKPQFTDTYPAALSHLELAERLVANIVGDSASLATKNAAVQDIKGALDGGWSRGDVIYTIFGNLGKKAVTDTVWGDTAKLFQNQMAVAKHFTETLDFSTTDLTTLRDALDQVSSKSDIASEDLMTQLIADGLMGLPESLSQSRLSTALPEDSAGLDYGLLERLVEDSGYLRFDPIW